KEAQKEDVEIWTIVENLDKQVEFRLDDDNVLWQDTRLVVPNDVSLREALLTEAHSSPFSVHPGSTKMYHDLKQYFREKLKEACTRQKCYADKHRKELEFQTGDHVFLKVSPARGVRRFGIKG
nr:putative reverse transcriptase domain-containing protein [Tanacetum cinerariifolium]